MKAVTNILAGLAGAVVLNIIHETARKYRKDAPHINEIGEEAVSKTIKAAGYNPPKGKKLYAATLGSDIGSNALYFGMIGTGDQSNVWRKGIAFGLAAGLGALGLTKPLGLNDAPVNRSTATKVMTVAWYTLGGIATAGVLKLLNRRNHS